MIPMRRTGTAASTRTSPPGACRPGRSWCGRSCASWAWRHASRGPGGPACLRQRAALMPVLPAGRSAAFLPQRPPRRRLVQPLAGRRPGQIPRRLPQPRLKLSDPLSRPGQLPKCPRQRSLRPGQLPAQRGQHLITGASIITRHTRTLLPLRITHAAVPHHRCPARLSRFSGLAGAWRVSGHAPRRGAGIWRGSDAPDRQPGDRAAGQPDQRRHTPRGRVRVTGYVAATLPLQLVV
jgi:hypothetical protein